MPAYVTACMQPDTSTISIRLGGPGTNTFNCPLNPDGTNNLVLVAVPASGQNNELDQLLNLSPSDGLFLSGLVATLWAVAWSFRAVSKALQADDPPEG